MNPASEFQLVLTTCQTNKQAKKIAATLVEQGLAACVNINQNVESVYLWKEQVSSESECLLIIKTRKNRFDQLRKTLENIHPYELPEIIAVPISAGSSGYLKWLDDCII